MSIGFKMQVADFSNSDSGEVVLEGPKDQETLDRESEGPPEGASAYSHDSEDCEAEYQSPLSIYLSEIAHGSCQADIDKIRTLLGTNGSLLYSAEDDKRTALHLAARYGLVDVAQELVDQRIEAKGDDAKTDEKDSSGYTPLHYASWYGHLDIVKLLLESNSSSINATGNDMWTPLHLAIWGEHDRVVSYLIGKGADLDMETHYGWTPLNTATPWSADIMEIILEHFKDGDKWLEKHTHTGYTPLVWTARKDKLDAASLLIKHGADCNALGPRDRTPLHWASKTGNKAMVELILPKATASIHKKSKSGNTPLHLACGVSQPDEDDWRSDEELNQDGDELAVYSQECQQDQHGAVIQLLLENGAKLATKNNDNETALHYAAERGEINRLKPLLQVASKEDLVAQNCRGWTVLGSAFGGDRPKTTMLFLLKHDGLLVADFGITDLWEDALKWAAGQTETHEIANLLVRKRPMPHDSRLSLSSNYIAIEFAAYATMPNVLSLLIENSPEDSETVKALGSALTSTFERIQERLEGRKDRIVEKQLLKVLWLLIPTLTPDPDIKKRVQKALDSVKKRKKELQEIPKSHLPKDDLKDKASDLRYRDEHQNREKGPDIGKAAHGAEQSNNKQNRKKDVPSDYLTELEDILRAPSRTKFYQRLKGVSPPKDRSELVDKVVAKSEASLTIFFAGIEESGTITRYRSMKDVIYGIGPKEIVKNTIEAMGSITDADAGLPGYSIRPGAEPDFIWIHLPSTNDLLARIMEPEENKSQQYHEVNSFFQSSMVHVPNEESQSRFLRPGTVLKHGTMHESDEQGSLGTQSTPTEDDEPESEEDVETKQGWMNNDGATAKRQDISASAIYMPYLCFSKHPPCQNGAAGSDIDDTNEMASEKMLDYKDFLAAYEKSAHESPTLDEWYYQFSSHDESSAKDKNTRNNSQVVTKYLRDAQTKGPHKERGSSATSVKDDEQSDKITLLRVSQLWARIIADKWLITATSCHPEDCHKGLDNEILDQLDEKAKSSGSGSQPSSAIEMSKLIVEYCIASFERPPTADSKYKVSPSQAFSHYLNRIGRDETALFDDFRQRTESWELRVNGNKQKKTEKDLAQSSSQAETKGSSQNSSQASPNDEIRDAIKKTMKLFCDIKDVRDELNMLRSVVQHQNNVQKGLDGESRQTSRLLSRTILGNIKEMDIVAERIQLAVNTTLSLQQSEIANYQATLSTSQGKTLMAFTFATVLFLPLSFLSSLFAMDVASFQQAPAWAFYVIFFVSIAVSVFLGSIAFHWDTILSQIKQQPLRMVKATGQALSSPSSIEVGGDIGARESSVTTRRRTGGSLGRRRKTTEDFSV
ncbi:hypothetical protein H9Q69_007311 [Fusarium xylarioides]|nr:hypothetical protein H9Q69_007311 [Fusarium xylarioides]